MGVFFFYLSLFLRISLLTTMVVPDYVQIQKLSPPIWSEDSVRAMLDGRPQVKWRCFCSVTGVKGRFPREGHGVAKGGEAPSFQNKKVSSSAGEAEGSMNNPSSAKTDTTQKAKQYAAQQLLRFIERNSKSNSNSNSDSPGGAPLTPGPEPPSTPSSKRLGLSQNSSPVQAPPSSSRRSNGSNPLGAVGDRDPTIFECVRRLAEELRLEAPTYSLAPTGDDFPEFFSGRAVFKPGSKVPDDVGVVRSVLGRRNAQVQAAQGTLVWLQGEKKRREDDLALLQGLQGLKPRS